MSVAQQQADRSGRKPSLWVDILEVLAPPNNPEVSTKRLLLLALPLLIPLLSQNLRLIVDTAVVGRLGAETLAAQGLTGFLAILLLTPFSALNSTVQALTSRLRGQSDAALRQPLYCAIGISIVAGAAYGALIWALAPFLVGLLAQDPEVARRGVEYLRPIMIGAPFAGLTSAFYGYWVGTLRPRVNLFVELVMQITNGVLAVLLVYGLLGFPELGIFGAGVALAASSVIGALIHLTVLRDPATINPLAWLRAGQAQSSMLNLIAHTVRLGLQNSIAFFLMYLIAQRAGVLDLAGFTVLIRLATILVYPAQAIATAAGSLAGGAIGAGQSDLAAAWARCAVRLGCLVTAVLGVPFWVAPYQILLGLTASREIAAIADLPLALLGLTIIFSGIGFVLTGILMATGGVNRVRKANFVTQWLVSLPLAFVLGPVFGFGLLGIWLGQVASRSLMVILAWRHWVNWRKTNYSLKTG